LLDDQPMIQENPFQMKMINSSDFCLYCVEFLEESLETLIELIVDTGLVRGCSSVCSQMDQKLEQVACTLFCDFIGVAEFVQIIEQ